MAGIQIDLTASDAATSVVKTIESAMAALEKQINNLSKVQDSLAASNQKIDASFAPLATRIRDTEQSLNVYNASLARVLLQQPAMAGAIGQASQAFGANSTAVANARASYDLYMARTDQLRSKIESLGEKLERQKTQYAELGNEYIRNNGLIDDNAAEINQLLGELGNLESDLQDVRAAFTNTGESGSTLSNVISVASSLWEAFGAVIGKIHVVLTVLWGVIQAGISVVRFFGDALGFVMRPLFDFLGAIGSAAIDAIKNFAGYLWSHAIAALKELGGGVIDLVVNGLRSLAGAIGNIIQIIIGVNLASLFRDIARGIRDMAVESFEAAGRFQMLGIQINGLIAVQEQQNSGIERTITTMMSLNDLTEDSSAAYQTNMTKIASLRDQYELLGPKIQIAKEKLQEEIAAGTLSGAEIELRTIQIQQMQQEYDDTAISIRNLSDSNQALLTSTSTVRDGQITMAEALERSKAKARELTDWIMGLATKSSLTVEQLTNMTRSLLAIGMGVEPAKETLVAFGNLTAGLGLTADQINRVEWNLTQTSRAMKITERDLREYGTAGLPVNAILDNMAQKFGITREAAIAFSKDGIEGVTAFNQAIVDFADKYFSGAMDRAALTWVVAKSNFKDIIDSIFGAELLGPAVEKFGAFVGGINSRIFGMRLQFREWGVEVGEIFQNLINQVQPVVDMLFSSAPWSSKLNAIFAVVSNWATQLNNLVWPFLLTLGQMLIDWVTPMIPGLIAKLGELIQNVLMWIGQQIPPMIAALQKWANEFIAWIGPLIPPMLQKLWEMIVSLWNWIGQQVPGWIEKLRQWGQVFTDWIAPLIPVMLQRLVELVQTLWNWVTTQTPIWIEKLRPWAESFIKWAVDMIPPLLVALGGIIDSVVNWILDSGNHVEDGLGSWTDKFLGWIGPLVQPLIDQFQYVLWPRVWDWLLETAGKLRDKLFDEWIPAFIKWVGPIWERLEPELGYLFGKFTGWLLLVALPKLIGAMLVMSYEMGKSALIIGANFMAGLADGINEHSGKASESVNAIAVQMLEDLAWVFDSRSPSRKTMELGRQFTDGLLQGINQNSSYVSQAVTMLAQGLLSSVQYIAPLFQWAGQSMLYSLASGIYSGMYQAQYAIQSIGNYFQQMSQTFHYVGQYMGQSLMLGLNQGLWDMYPMVMNTARSIADQIAATIRAALAIRSPSGVFIDIGQQIMAGLQIGMNQPIMPLVQPMLAGVGAGTVPGARGGYMPVSNVYNESRSTGPITLNIYGSSDPRETARLVIRELQDRDLLPR